MLLLPNAVHGQSGFVHQRFDGIHNGEFGVWNTPADISGAAGESGLLQVANGAVAYFPKKGDFDRVAVWGVPLAGQGGVFPQAGQCFKPRVCYDFMNRRFLFAALEIDNVARKSYLRIAASKTAHPDGMADPMNPGRRIFDPSEWHRYRYDFTRTTGSFSPGSPGGANDLAMAVDEDNLLVTVNFQGISGAAENTRFNTGLEEAGLFMFFTGELVTGFNATPDGSGAPLTTRTPHFPSPTDGFIQPATSKFSRSQAHFIGLDQDAVDTFIDTTYLPYTAAPAEDHQTDLGDLLIPDPAPQPGGALNLAHPADRMTGAARSNQTTIGVFVAEAADSDRSVVKVAHALKQADATVVKLFGLDAGNGRWNMIPAIALNPYNCVCVAWTASAENANPSVHYAIAKDEQTLLFGGAQTLITSATPYFGGGPPGASDTAWGDYGAVCVDPVDNSFWVCMPYAATAGPDGWGSYWANISPSTPPDIVKQLHITTQANPTPNFGNVETPGEVGEPIRVIRVCQGQSLSLACDVRDQFGQNFRVGGYTLKWKKDGQDLDDFVNKSSIDFSNIPLSLQGVYQIVLSDDCGVLTFGEKIYLDVVAPVDASLNQTRLRLGPGSNGYFEVLLNPATAAEMGATQFQWNRGGSSTLLDGRVLTVSPQTVAQAETLAGSYTCVVSNFCGSVELGGDVVTGPSLASAPAIGGSGVVCAPESTISISGLGVGAAGPAGSARPDFGAGHSSTLWTNDLAGWTSVVWRKDGTPLKMGGRFSVQASATGTEPVTHTLRIANPDYEDEGLYDAIVTDRWGADRAIVSQPVRFLLSPLAPPYLTVGVAGGPAYRQGAGMVYDSQRKRMVLFGGEAYGLNPRTGSATATRHISNETWEWDGRVWLRRNPSSSPPGLTNFGMAYDSHRGRVVVFGGYEYSAPDFNAGTQTLSNKVWEWDGQSWRQTPSSTASPLARSSPSLCFDSVRREILMIGGVNFSPTPSGAAYLAATNTLWAWNGAKWTEKSVLPAPFQVTASNTAGNAFAFDAHRGVACLFGSFFNSSNPVLEFNGSSWRLVGLAPAMSVGDSTGAGAFYDPYRRLVCLPVSYDRFPSATGADFGKSFLACWNGSEFIRGEAIILNDIDGVLPDPGFRSPESAQGDLTAYDPDRRCLVFRDNLTNSFFTSATAMREMHFSGKAKIVHSPAHVMLSSNGGVTLSVAAAGLRPLDYQWFKDGVAVVDDGRVSGARTANLTISNATAADAGAYSVRVTNGHSTVNTSPTTVAPSSDSLVIHANGGVMTLSWSGIKILETSRNLSDPWAVIPGATSPYVISADEGSRFFRVR